MATKTIPEYLEDERRNRADTELRTEEEAAHIQSLHHGHHRTPKPPKPELPAPVKAVAKARKTIVVKTRKTATAKTRKPAADAQEKPPERRERKLPKRLNLLQPKRENLPQQLGESHPPPERRQRKPARWRDDPCTIFAVAEAPYSLVLPDNPVQDGWGEGSADFDGHDLSDKILPR
jgi:hypothetical protein